MIDDIKPNQNDIYPIAGYDNEIYVKPTVTNPNIIVGDFTYIADSDFESHVTHLYDHIGDNNHQMNAVTTFPFYTLKGWKMNAPSTKDLPLKGDTIIGNDVWIGQNAVILPGAHIGDGAIIGANCVVGGNVEPYTIVIGNPARKVRKRFDDELIDLLLCFKWWDKSIEEINELIPLLTCSDLRKVKEEIKNILNNK